MLSARQALLAAATGLLAIVALEGSLALLALASHDVAKILALPWEPAGLPDVRLGSRPNPLAMGHDANGFRNRTVPSRAEIIAFGDSQTYGTGVSADEAWPSHLRRLAGRSVYNMSFGGFGPVHTLQLWEDGLALEPHIVIEALYTGNDLYDAFAMVYNRSQFEDLKTADPDLELQIRNAEDAEPIAQRVDRLVLLCSAPQSVSPLAAESGDGSSLQWLLKEHSGLYGIARRARFVVQDMVKPEVRDGDEVWREYLGIARKNPDYCQGFDDGVNRTIFTHAYRLNALNVADQRIAEGARIVMASLIEMHKRATARGIRFIVLEIPTKELVFEPLVAEPAASFSLLVEYEQHFRARLHRELDTAGIERIDALPALREELAAQNSPYRPSDDGHPNEVGQRAIARLVATHLVRGSGN